MNVDSIQELSSLMQSSISPVVLISGIGLLLLSMTNRIARVIDRVRQLTDEKKVVEPEMERVLHMQIENLYKRAKNLRSGIILMIGSVLMAALIIITLFISQLYRLPITIIIVVEFFLCLVSLIISLLFYIKDISLTLKALDYKIDQ